MATSKWTRRAKNVIAPGGGLVTTGPPVDPTVSVHHSGGAFRVAPHTIFTAEFERVIEIIAIDRVYRAMLAKLGNRMLAAPTASDISGD